MNHFIRLAGEDDFTILELQGTLVNNPAFPPSPNGLVDLDVGTLMMNEKTATLRLGPNLVRGKVFPIGSGDRETLVIDRVASGGDSGASFVVRGRAIRKIIFSAEPLYDPSGLKA